MSRRASRFKPIGAESIFVMWPLIDHAGFSRAPPTGHIEAIGHGMFSTLRGARSRHHSELG